MEQTHTANGALHSQSSTRTNIEYLTHGLDDKLSGSVGSSTEGNEVLASSCDAGTAPAGSGAAEALTQSWRALVVLLAGEPEPLLPRPDGSVAYGRESRHGFQRASW